MPLVENLPLVVGDLTLTPGRWVELGVSHWHCVVREPEGVSVSRRYDHDRMERERLSSSAHVVTSPDEVLAWLGETADEIAGRYGVQRPSAQRRDIWLRMVEHGMDVCTMMTVSESRIVHLSAYALTAGECAVHSADNQRTGD
jgi:hypothetical protein